MDNKNRVTKIGVLLMTYGSATTADNVEAYMERIYHGKASRELIEDFEERYRLVGRSPLVDITKEQARLVEEYLNSAKGEEDARDTSTPDASDTPAPTYIVRAAMLHSDPLIDDIVLELKQAGAEELRGVILSPQFSSFIMDGYAAALERAAEHHGFVNEAVFVAEPWPTEPYFITLLANRIRTAMQDLEEQYGTIIPVLFTTHSLPQRVVEKDPQYLEQLQQTINAVVAEIGDPALDWHACYQSAGHTPEEWLKPDLTDILAIAEKDGDPAVLIAPIQFLADHLEILYDLDIAAKEQCDERGIAYHRIELPNTDPLFIKALATIAKG